MPIRPLLLKGHERPLTCVKFNRDSDLLFTCAKDYKPNVWYSDNGERLGTYNGHEGAVYDCDMNFHSTKLLTGSADRTVRLWEIESGKELFRWKFEAAIRSVGFAEGDSMMLAVQDNTFSQHPTIFLYDLSENIEDQQVEAAKELKVHYDSDVKHRPKFNKALWGPLNQTVVSCGDDGYLRVWDVETGVEKARVAAHKKAINCIQFSKDRSMIITASADQTAQVYDYRELRLLRTFTSDRPLNSAAISPIANHVIIGGGQEAMNVTTTAAKAGHFEVDFYNMVYSEYLGSVKGHFGPINTLAFSPNGKIFASGSEDGYVRLHHFDKDYLKNKE